MAARESGTDAWVSLQRATVYLSLARALSYPTPAILASITGGELGGRLRTALAESDPPAATWPALAAFERVIAATGDQTVGLAEEYTYLFLRQAPAPPYETSHGRDRLHGRTRGLEEVRRYYTAFGFQVSVDHPDLPDHVGAELEFVGLLWAKEAYALDNGRADDALTCREARQCFIGRHMLPWLPRFRERLEQNARLGFYPALIDLALTVLSPEAPEAPMAEESEGVGMEPDEKDAFTCPVAPDPDPDRQE
jgi:DMSO reductase family type II enzyme chaperone